MQTNPFIKVKDFIKKFFHKKVVQKSVENDAKVVQKNVEEVELVASPFIPAGEHYTQQYKKRAE